MDHFLSILPNRQTNVIGSGDEKVKNAGFIDSVDMTAKMTLCLIHCYVLMKEK